MTQTHDPEAETKAVPTGIQLTTLDQRFREDPYPVLDELRTAEPVHRDTQLSRFVITRHDDVHAVLGDRAHSVDPRKATPGSFEAMFATGADVNGEPSMLFSDPPYHTRLRSLVTKAFTPKAVEALRPHIEDVCNELLDAVAGREGFDVMDAYASPLPTIIIAEMLGVDPADRDDFKRWSDSGVQTFNPQRTPEQTQAMADGQAAMSAYLLRAVTERRAQPREDMITALIDARDENGDSLTDQEIVTMCALLLAAGNVTTTDLIGNGVRALLMHPEELRKLRDDPSLIKNAVEEILRYDTPVTQSGRTPLSDIEVSGCPVKAGDSITPSLAAANRDPALHADPHRFDVTREDTHHHAFGGGIHTCLGAPLARLEAQIALSTLFARFPHMRLSETEPMTWKNLPSFRGLATLPVRVDPA